MRRLTVDERAHIANHLQAVAWPTGQETSRTSTAELQHYASLPGLVTEKVALHLFSAGVVTQKPDERSEEIFRRYEALSHEATIVSNALKRAGAEHVFLKGFGFQHYYPDGWLRQLNDLDVLLRNSDHLGLVLGALQDVGFVLGRPAVARRHTEGVWAAMSLRKPSESLSEPLYLDLTTEGPGLDILKHYRLPDAAWNSVEHAMLPSGAVPILTGPYSLVTFFIEIVERHSEGQQITVRDIFDFLALVRHGVNLDECRDILLTLGLGETPSLFRPFVSENIQEVVIDRLHPIPPGERSRKSRVPKLTRSQIHRFSYGVFARLAFALEMVHLSTALRLYRRIPVTPAFNHGYPIYLFPTPILERKQKRCHLDASGLGSLVARVRPVLDEAEFEAAFP